MDRGERVRVNVCKRTFLLCYTWGGAFVVVCFGGFVGCSSCVLSLLVLLCVGFVWRRFWCAHDFAVASADASDASMRRSDVDVKTCVCGPRVAERVLSFSRTVGGTLSVLV